MDINIICWNLDNRMNLSDIESPFKEISKTEEIYYFKMGEKKIEIAMSNSNCNEFKESYIDKRTNNKLSVIMVEEITIDNFQVIKSAIECNHFLVIAGKYSLDLDNDKVLNKVIKLPQLYYGEDILDIKSIIFMLYSIYKNEKFNLDEVLGRCIILGSKDLINPLGEVPLYILKRFNYLKSFNNLNLTIYIKEEMNIECVTYIEDPLREYIEDNSVLKIRQIINKEIGDKIYFSLIGK